jgi:2-phospho-L-lactate/phosphoenolpyruvate guanylyltransferase
MSIWAVVPVKDVTSAKQRLAGVLAAALRQELSLAMLEDVLATLVAVPELAGILVATVDARAAALANRFGASVSSEDAAAGHTEAVAAAACRLARQGSGMLTVPADIPLVGPQDIQQLLAVSHSGFAIVPARDGRGSNAVLCAPADAVPLRFGSDSFLPHLAAARACGIAPATLRLPRIGLDIDVPDDLVEFMKAPSRTRAHALLAPMEALR